MPASVSDWTNERFASNEPDGSPSTLVDQNQARSVLLEDGLEQVRAWRDAVGIILRNHVEGFGAAELPRQLAPGRANLAAALGIENVLRPA